MPHTYKNKKREEGERRKEERKGGRLSEALFVGHYFRRHISSSSGVIYHSETILPLDTVSQN